MRVRPVACAGLCAAAVLLPLTRSAGAVPQPALIAIAGDLRANLVPKVYAVDVQNGARTNIAGLEGEWDPVLSPDRTSLAFISARDGYDAVYVTRADGSGARRVTPRITTPSFGGLGCDAGESHPLWSPDGSRIVFEVVESIFCNPPAPPAVRRSASARYTVSTPHKLAVVNADGSDLRMLVDGFFPRWSPDGTRLAYVERSPYCFCLQPGTTSAILDLGSGASRPLGPGTRTVWATDGHALALAGSGVVRVFSRDGNLLRTLRGTSAGWTRCGLVTARSGPVAVSPDLRQAALSDRSGIVLRTCSGRSKVFVRGGYEPVSFAPDGASLLVRRCAGNNCALAIANGRKLVPFKAAYRPTAQQPAWSPGGAAVAFMGDSGIAVADSASGATQTLTIEDASVLTTPIWTDEATVVYGSVASGVESNVYAVENGNVSLVARDAAHPALSPDGPTVAYAKPPGIWLADATGTRARVLLKTSATGLAWSPDGAQLAFSTGTEVDITDLHGIAHRVVGPASNMQVFAWSPDGQWLAYSSLQADITAQGVWIVHPDGTGSRLFIAHAARLAWSPDGSRIAYTESGNLFVADAAGNDAVAFPGPFVQTCLSWPAQGGGIVAAEFVRGSYREGLFSRLFALTPDGSGKTALMDVLSVVNEAG